MILTSEFINILIKKINNVIKIYPKKLKFSKIFILFKEFIK